MAMMEFMDPTAAKIVLSAHRGDSINRIANKIGTSYSWVYEWIERLEEKNIIAVTDNGIQVVDHELCEQFGDMMAALYRREQISQEDAYVIPHFAGMEFAYTEIDAAYVWTHGGYQIARSHDDYPIFINVHDRDVDRWIAFFEQYGSHTTITDRVDKNETDGDIYYVLFPATDGFEVDWVEGNPVIPVEEAVEQMKQHRPAYEPALEIIDQEYAIDIDATHHEETAIENTSRAQ